MPRSTTCATVPLRVLLAAGAVAVAACGGGGSGDRDGGLPPPDGGLGDVPCQSDAECPAGRCLQLFQARSLDAGYCSLACTSRDDCGAMVDGNDYDCIDLGEEVGRQCVRVCRDGFGCALETDLCVELPLGGARRDVCLDTRRISCTADRDCDGDEGRFCLPVTDRERLVPLCLVPQAPLDSGRRRFEADLQGTGASCDHPGDPEGPGADFCTDPDQCPGGRCYGRDAGARACFPPEEERCALFCSPFGQCAGLCDEDPDCPSTMRCSRVTTTLGQADPDVFDDSWVTQGLCTYAAGSRTPCRREADCAGTGPGGDRETCLPSVDLDGEVGGICVTPVPGVGLPGDSCGDDPATDEVEVRECHASCESLRCVGLCGDDDDCDAGSRCRPVLLDAARTATVCVPDSDCRRDLDCSDGEVCVPSGTATAIDGRCEPAGGALPPGAVCRVTDEGDRPPPFSERCTLGCLDVGEGPLAGRCSASCETSADCPEDAECVVEERTLVNRGTLARTDDVTAEVRFCRHLPGLGAVCENAADCGATGTCVSYRPAGTGTPRRRCIQAEPRGVPLGGSCRGELPCRDRDCFEPWFEPDFPICTALCQRDRDCPEPLVCRQVLQGDAAVAPQQCVTADDPRIVGG